MAQHTPNILGLTDQEANQRLAQFGYNYVAEQRRNSVWLFLSKFWAPIPWLLELTIILQLMIGKTKEAIIIAILLCFNATLSFLQEDRANKALALLKECLAINAKVLRQGQWRLIPVKNLVPQDIISIRMGDIVPADMRIASGKVLLDQSALTGESLPIECDQEALAYSGSIVKSGEAVGMVIATGSNTYFGKTIELASTTNTPSHIKTIIFTIIKYLVTTTGVLATIILLDALAKQQPLIEVLPYTLILLVAAIPIALPTTFSLATALGAKNLVAKGVLVTRLSAIEEAAVMSVVCLDKTGTITSNTLQLVDWCSCAPFSRDDLLRFAASAATETTQDPIDLAIIVAARAYDLLNTIPPERQLVPFDSLSKRTEAIFKHHEQVVHVLKGSPEALMPLLTDTTIITPQVLHFETSGYKTLLVVINDNQTKQFKPVGLLAFSDPPRQEAATLIARLHNLGLRTVMITGDSAITAQTIAQQIGLGNKICQSEIVTSGDHHAILACDIFANVFPQDKFRIVQTLQKLGNVVGMTGDGVNDAPALKLAEVGIAVANAVDTAKAASSLVLTRPGFGGIVAVIETSRQIHKRMLTYVLNKIAKSFEIAIFLTFGFIFTNTLMITPSLMVLLLFTNDFMTMAIATDNTVFSPKPERWRIANLVLGGGVLAVLMLFLAFTVFWLGRNYLHLSLSQLQTLIFLLLVFTGQGTIYLVRERKHLWHSWPSKWLLLSSLMNLLIVITMATTGIMMTAISPILIGMLLGIIIIYLLLIDLIKVPMFAYLKILN